MPEANPQDLTNMHDVATYWRQCLKELDSGMADTVVASHMVGVAANSNDGQWSNGVDAHPAYPIIFELAASLELPEDMTGQREERWACIRALVSALEQHYLN